MKRPEHDRFRLTRGLPPTSLLHAVIASSNRPVGRPPCMKEPEFRRILRPVGQLFLVRSGATKQPPRSSSLRTQGGLRVNPNLSCSDSVLINSVLFFSAFLVWRKIVLALAGQA